MLEITKEQIETIRGSDELGDLVRGQLSDPSLASKNIASITAEEWEKLDVGSIFCRTPGSSSELLQS
jgi:hypothetical protein